MDYVFNCRMHKKNLKKYYFINNFDEKHILKIDKNVDIIYRNYNKTINLKSVNNIKKLCKKTNRKFYLGNNIRLAIKLDLDGAYIPSFNKSLIHNIYETKKKFNYIGSAHNIREANIKRLQKVTEIFIAPVFKKKVKKIGLFGFLKFKKLYKQKIIALGGINKDNIKKLKSLNADGFAAIEYFKKKRPL